MCRGADDGQSFLCLHVSILCAISVLLSRFFISVFFLACFARDIKDTMGFLAMSSMTGRRADELASAAPDGTMLHAVPATTPTGRKDCEGDSFGSNGPRV